MEYVFLTLAGVLAGMINSIAGGGIFVVLPLMIVAGATGKQADASGSFAVWLGQVTSLFENRKLLPKKSLLVHQVIACGILGSIVGSLLLVMTPNVSFEHALPYLNAAATCIFIAGTWLKKQRTAGSVPTFVFPLFLLAAGIYGGYFGGGLGLLMLAILSMTNLRDIKQQNTVKLLSASVTNTVAVAILITAQLVVWRWALPAGLGALAGGYIGAKFSKRVPVETIRILVIIIGLVTTAYLFLKFYR